MLWSHTLVGWSGWGPKILCLCPKHASFFTISQGCLESGMSKSAGHLCLRPFPPWALEVKGLMCRLVGLFGEAHHRCILQPAAKFQVSFTGIDSAKRWASHQSRVLFSTPKNPWKSLVESWQIEHDRIEQNWPLCGSLLVCKAMVCWARISECLPWWPSTKPLGADQNGFD